MSSLANDITKLKQAIRSGATKVTYKDRSVEYRSLSEMRSVLADMEVEAGTRTSGRRRTNPTYDNGL